MVRTGMAFSGHPVYIGEKGNRTAIIRIGPLGDADEIELELASTAERRKLKRWLQHESEVLDGDGDG